MSITITWRRTDAGEGSGGGHLSLSLGGSLVVGRGAECSVRLDDATVSRRHAEISVSQDGVTITDLGSGNGTLLDGRRIARTLWPPGARVRIGSFELMLSSVADSADPSRLLEPGEAEETPRDFPGALFARQIVPMSEIRASGKLTGEATYLAIGGGLGSFVWVDTLRVFGVPAAAIRVIGLSVDRKPYAKYARLCRNSQIPDHERIRSNSISAPDNVWGFPGYASREAWRELKKGNVGGLYHLWQVFAEPVLAESYTPRAGDVFRSLDQEARRIGWDGMWMAGQVLSLRKTDDERFVIAYRVPREAAGSGGRERLVVARHVHVATGYPAFNFLPDLQAFRHANPAATMVVNAYEEHEALYRQLEQNGGAALVRGRGIVASRVIQRLNEARARNPSIRIIHVMRAPVKEGSRFEWARRAVLDNVEHQPFNWPKACWGGSLRKRIEQADPEQRSAFFGPLGGTTTAFRSDWRKLIADGTADGWYHQRFGEVAGMELSNGRIVSTLKSTGERVESDCVIDCTGLIARLDAMPHFKDLIDTYGLARNSVSGSGIERRLSGLAVTNSFEIAGLANGRGSVHASGVVVANGPYAAVDSFLGLQYAALRAVDNLYRKGAPSLTRMGASRSLAQWLRWCWGASP